VAYLLVGDKAGDQEADGDVEHGADGQGGDRAEGEVPLRVLALLRRRAHGVEANVPVHDTVTVLSWCLGNVPREW
jgi:hypothetical protein